MGKVWRWSALRVGGVWLAAMLCLPPSAHAWGAEGHRLVADLAQEQLRPAAQERIRQLLVQEGLTRLADISTWADDHRNPATAPWHYVNFPRDSCTYVAARECPDGRCVVGAVERQAELVARSDDPAQALLALKYLVHLVADLHQPLHAGYQDDRGGNNVQLQVLARGSNLHALWDTHMIRALDEQQPSWRAGIRLQRPAGGYWSAPLAAAQSCQWVGMPGFYPEGRVGMDYVVQFTPVLQHQIGAAAAHLADLLNAAWR